MFFPGIVFMGLVRISGGYPMTDTRTLSSPAALSTSFQTTSYATRSENVCQSCTSSDAYVQAEGNCVSLQRESDSYLLRESISVVAEKLKPYGFIRIHRSTLVNTSFVEELAMLSTGKYG